MSRRPEGPGTVSAGKDLMAFRTMAAVRGVVGGGGGRGGGRGGGGMEREERSGEGEGRVHGDGRREGSGVIETNDYVVCYYGNLIIGVCMLILLVFS